MDDATLTIVAALRKAGVPVMITVAPEAVTATQISALAATGAVVSLGHSDANAETTRAALGAGASCFTHLFNAMSPLLNRAPGVTGAAINSAAHAGIICDGVHVADELVAMAIRARPVPDTMFIVSDAMPTVGGPDHFDLYGAALHLHDGRLVNAEGSLAGAHITMAQSVARLVSVVGIERQQALRMAVTIPAGLMGLDALARIEGRLLSDVLVLDDAFALQQTLGDLALAAA
jgi:N-acetylglucosamine-6-phosphate deacetylase